MSFKSILQAGALAFAAIAAPMTAQAVTITSTGVAGAFECSGPGLTPAADIDVLAGASFDAVFDDGDAGGTYCFDLINTSASTVAVTLLATTVSQIPGVSFFAGGVSTYAPTVAALNYTVAEGASFSANETFLIAAGDSIIFDWTFGTATAAGGTKPEFDFQVFATPVPVPAAGLLLIGGLGGLAALRRRRKAA